MARKLRVAIDCRIADPMQGTGTAVLALAKALSESEISGQEYTFLVRADVQDWFAPYIYGPCRLEAIREEAPSGQARSPLSQMRAAARRITPLRWVWRKFRGPATHRFEVPMPVPSSDGYVEGHDFDVVHFPTQLGYLTELPTIYQPWDLQHLHYPQFFSEADLAWREAWYRTFCNQASYVCVQTEWTKNDLISHYGIAGKKVVVIPWGSVFDAYESPAAEEIQNTVEKYGLPDCFFFYPAVTWPHKNHETILRALHILKRDHGIVVKFFFTGSSRTGGSTGVQRILLDKLALDLGVSEQVRFLGFVSPTELQAIFKTATAMIFPSRFEGFGLPILEAFHAQVPVLSSNATTLPEVARDGALYFDPDSPAELSALMMTVINAPEVRRDLIRKGTLVLSQYSIDKTAAMFQALYERTAALPRQDQ
jgi:glycosyltransferase involved in cell wall biosynthesis